MNESPRYAVEFQAKLMRVKCKVEVVVDLGTAYGSATISGMQFMGSRPAFSVALDDLVHLRDAIRMAQKALHLLSEPLPGASERQINCQYGCAAFVVVGPKDMAARYSMKIGNIHREGELSSYDSRELDEAIDQINSMLTAVKATVSTLPRP